MEEKKNEENISEEIPMQEVDDVTDIVVKLKEELEEQKAKADEYVESLKRNMAEFDNFKKRIIKEKETLYTSVLSDVIETLLPVIDNFEKAMVAECKDVEYKNGIDLIYKDMLNVLKKYNIEAIEDIGCTFDPMYHEAVMSVTDETKGEKEIVEVFRRGYRLGEKVVRHSLVKVAN